METLIAALRTGADAVYAGGKKFSARNNAANFSDSQLEDAVRLCHLYGAKLYLAVNTVIADNEAEAFRDHILHSSKIGVDGYIVQDHGAADIIKCAVPDAVLHASTQMSVHTAAGTELLKKLGYSRVVPARELDKYTLKKISGVGLETEVFVHGALCMSVSGQCYMSAMMGSRSANRGCCGQACRLPCSASGKKDTAALSLKDLSLLPVIDELVAAGADSLKIEGRMKRPEYVASAVSELKKALGGMPPDMLLLKGIFSRSGFTDGYFTGDRSSMFGKREKEDVTAAQELIPKIHELYRSERQVHIVNFFVTVKAGQPAAVKAVCGNISAEVTGDVPAAAKNRPTDIEAAARQLSKLGDTVFTAGNISGDIGDGLFIPAGKLNEMRRQLTDKLSQLMIKHNTPVYTLSGNLPELPVISRKPNISPLPLRVLCFTPEQARTAADENVQFIIPGGDMCFSEEKLTAAGLLDIPDKVILSPPRFITDEDKLIQKLIHMRSLGFSRLLCHTYDHIAVGKKLGFKLHGNFTLNLYNSYSAEKLRDIGLEDCAVSFEMKLSQINSLRTSLPLGAAVCGRLPLMLTRNCPVKNEVGCRNCTGHIIDRTGRELPVHCEKDYVEILNTDTLFMLDRLSGTDNLSFGLVLLYNNENADETKLLLSGKSPAGNITRGLYYRGIQEVT